MSSPLSNLKKEKKMPFGSTRSRSMPFKPKALSEEELLAQIKLDESVLQYGDGKKKKVAPKVSDNSLMSSMMTRLTLTEKQLAEAEAKIKEKDRRIYILEEKCKIYKNAQGYGEENIMELEKKCHKLQKQIHSMELFLEDYGMIWVGSGESDDDDSEVHEIDEMGDVWMPDQSVSNQGKYFVMDFDLVMKNLMELNLIAGEGEHFIKHTKEGARLQVKDSIPLTLYANGIFMFGGPFRPYTEQTTQQCMQDIMDGYFPSELQSRYPDGVPFKVHDKRDFEFRDKRLEKLFPGEGKYLLPEKEPRKKLDSDSPDTVFENKLEEKGSSKEKQKTVKTLYTPESDHQQSVDHFLSKLPSSVIKKGCVIDIREGIENTLKDKQPKNDIIVVETDVVKEMKSRLNLPKNNRPQTPGKYATLRVKSETGDQTYILKMKYYDTIKDVRHYLDMYRADKSAEYEIKSSFPNMTYTDTNKTLREYNLVPNATLHIVPRKL